MTNNPKTAKVSTKSLVILLALVFAIPFQVVCFYLLFRSEYLNSSPYWFDNKVQSSFLKSLFPVKNYASPFDSRLEFVDSTLVVDANSGFLNSFEEDGNEIKIKLKSVGQEDRDLKLKKSEIKRVCTPREPIENIRTYCLSNSDMSEKMSEFFVEGAWLSVYTTNDVSSNASNTYIFIE